MKRVLNIICVLVMGVVMTSCNQEDDSLKLNENLNAPLTFSAFSSQMVSRGVPGTTRGSIVTPSIFQTQGIGVFAFHQKAKSNGVAVDYNHNLGEPDFMYNQQVTGADDGTGNIVWTYDPVKYWPNNENDKLSFFAYAPYDYTTSWDEDMDITCNLQGTKFKKSFPINDYPEDQKDYLWADPVLNLLRGAIDYHVQFDFSHVCAQVGFMVGVKEDEATGVTAWTDPNTDIVIKSLKLTKVYSDYNLSLIYNKTSVPQFTHTWTTDGSQTVTLVNDAIMGNMVEQGIISINPTYHTFTSTDWNTTTWGEATYKRLNKDDSYLFLAPQVCTDQNIVFTLTYDIKTRNLKKSPVETNTITRTFTHKMSDLGLTNNAFEKGKAYTIKYLLGISGIQVTAEVTDWVDKEVVISVSE